jgi:hypothetical protein
MRLRQGLVHAIDGYKNCCIDFVQSESIVIYGEHKMLKFVETMRRKCAQ